MWSNRFIACVFLLACPCANAAESTTRPLTAEERGDIYVARKRFLEAVDMYQQQPPSARMENKIGIAFHEMSQLEIALKHYEKAIKLDHKYADAINNLGTIYYSEHEYHRAIQYFKRSLKCS